VKVWARANGAATAPSNNANTNTRLALAVIESGLVMLHLIPIIIIVYGVPTLGLLNVDNTSFVPSVASLPRLRRGVKNTKVAKVAAPKQGAYADPASVQTLARLQRLPNPWKDTHPTSSSIRMRARHAKASYIVQLVICIVICIMLAVSPLLCVP
jgi:hypothetical protein